MPRRRLGREQVLKVNLPVRFARRRLHRPHVLEPVAAERAQDLRTVARRRLARLQHVRQACLDRDVVLGAVEDRIVVCWRALTW